MTNRLKKFVRGEDGSTTVEAVIWMPMFFILLLTVIDISMYLFSMNQAWSVARDVTRQVAVGDLEAADARAAVLSYFNDDEAIQVSVATSDSNEIEFVMTMPNRMIISNFFNMQSINNVNIRYFMLSELPAQQTPEGN